MKLSPDQQRRLDELLYDLEQKSRIECVLMHAPHSGAYWAGALWLSIIFLWVALLLFFFLPIVFGNYTILLGTLGAQVLGFVLGRVPSIQRWVTPSKVMQRQVNVTARAIFEKARLYQTSEGTAFLIFVSDLEQQIALVLDGRIENHFPLPALQEATEAFNNVFKAADPAEALLKSLEKMAVITAEYAPDLGTYINELPNKIDIEL